MDQSSRALGGVYIALCWGLGDEATKRANEALLAFADDELTDEATAETYRALANSLQPNECPGEKIDARQADNFAWLAGIIASPEFQLIESKVS